MPILNVAAYKFVDLHDLQPLRAQLREQTRAHGLKGTILLAPEGINLFLAGEATQLEAFLTSLCSDARFADMPIKRSRSDEQPFNRMLVKLKREIITMNRPEVRPTRRSAPRVAPRELKRWLDEGREVVLLDTRNAFEVEIGSFAGAHDFGLKSFSHFPHQAEQRLQDWRDKTIVTFCTGGIRCEKAAPWMLDAGFKDVYQLDGGILKYFEECGGAHYEGECFVFDKRVALDGTLRETGTTQCYACQAVLSIEDQRSPEYELGISCPHCIAKPQAAKRAA